MAVGGAVLLYYDCKVFVGAVMGTYPATAWHPSKEGTGGSLLDRYDRNDRYDRGQPRAAAFLFWAGGEGCFLVLSEVCRFCANGVRTIL